LSLMWYLIACLHLMHFSKIFFRYALSFIRI